MQNDLPLHKSKKIIKFNRVFTHERQPATVNQQIQIRTVREKQVQVLILVHLSMNSMNSFDDRFGCVQLYNTHTHTHIAVFSRVPMLKEIK